MGSSRAAQSLINVARANGKSCGADVGIGSENGGGSCSAFCDESCYLCSHWILPLTAEKAWALHASLEEHREIDEGDSRYDEAPPEEDRKEEAERPHAPAQQREALMKQTRKRGRSESERVSSLKWIIFLNGLSGCGIQFVCSFLLCNITKLTTICVYRPGKPSSDRIRTLPKPAKAI